MKIFKTIFFIFAALVMFLLIIDTITKKEINLKNTLSKSGKFQSIEKERLPGKWSISTQSSFRMTKKYLE